MLLNFNAANAIGQKYCRNIISSPMIQNLMMIQNDRPKIPLRSFQKKIIFNTIQIFLKRSRTIKALLTI